jgi:hypothetical protein
MTLSRKRRVAIAAAIATAAIAVPAGSAHAATFPPFPAVSAPAASYGTAGWTLPALPAGLGSGIAATGWGGTPAAALNFTGPSIGQVAAVIGPTIITTAPSTFINTNNQVTAGSAVSGGQASGAAGPNG